MQEPKICECGNPTRFGQTKCPRCHTRVYRDSDLALRRRTEASFSVLAAKGCWPEREAQWIELQNCHGPDLASYLKSRSGKRQVWPNTDHSLVCWMDSQRDPEHICYCGADKLAYETARK